MGKYYVNCLSHMLFTIKYEYFSESLMSTDLLICYITGLNDANSKYVKLLPYNIGTILTYYNYYYR